MAIPLDILAVERPKNTVVKQRGKRFVVIKRTSKRIGKRVLPVDLMQVGEIIDGKYMESTAEKRVRRRTVDIKDYGEVALCHKHGRDLFDEIAKVWNLGDAKRLYAIALLRSAYGDIKNRDLAMFYETSFVSELFPGLGMSEQSVSTFLQDIGKSYVLICKYMQNRVEKFADRRIVIDGMLKDYNSETGWMSEFSRKARTKGSKDLNLLYAYDPQSHEPVAAKPYPGNMLDSTAVEDFISEYGVKRGLMIFDKGFWNDSLFESIDGNKDLAYLIPIKQNSKLIGNYGMDNPTEILDGYKEAAILHKKVRMSNGKYLYGFRDPKLAAEQETAYVLKSGKKGSFSPSKYEEAKPRFGLIVFKSTRDLNPLDAYMAYDSRWDIEVIFNLYKNIIEHDTVNVHSDYSVIATELVNFLSTIISSRVKTDIVKKEINKVYSFKQIFRYMSKYKKVRSSENGAWKSATMLKYIEELASTLGV